MPGEPSLGIRPLAGCRITEVYEMQGDFAETVTARFYSMIDEQFEQSAATTAAGAEEQP